MGMCPDDMTHHLDSGMSFYLYFLFFYQSHYDILQYVSDYLANTGPQQPNNNQRRPTTHNTPQCSQQKSMRANKAQQSSWQPVQCNKGASGDRNAPRQYDIWAQVCLFTYIYYSFTNYILIYYNISVIIQPTQAHSSPTRYFLFYIFYIDLHTLSNFYHH